MFGNKMLVPGGFSDLIDQNIQNSNWKKLLGFRNMQEKLEKINCRKIKQWAQLAFSFLLFNFTTAEFSKNSDDMFAHKY